MTQLIPQLLRRLWHHISPRRRGQFALLLVLMILASFAEILNVSIYRRTLYQPYAVHVARNV